MAPRTESTLSPRIDLNALVMVLVIAGLLRLALICWRPESLAEDRDLYWGIAERLAAGDGFQHSSSEHPTAYRPPLYPLMLAWIIAWGGRVFGLAVVQTGLSVATVWLTWSLGRSLNLGRWSIVAAAFVATNPLLVHSNSQAMTETVCAFLVMAAIRVALEVVSKPDSDVAAFARTRVFSVFPRTLASAATVLKPPLGEPPSVRRLRSLLQPFALGLLCGLAALTRPTVFAFVMLATVIVLLRQFCHGKPTRTWIVNGVVASVTFALTLTPWGLRNAYVFGTPIFTTTHGGYTLLLGNNDEAYRAEVAQPFGTLWDSRPWQQSLENEMAAAGLARSDEVGRDRYLSEKAWTWIRQHPREFVAACWLRARRFWNVRPVGSDAESLPTIARWGMTIFFSIELLLAIVGLYRMTRADWSRWWPLIVLIVSFAAVHLVYWSNLRMRAPIEPALSLLASFSVIRVRR